MPVTTMPIPEQEDPRAFKEQLTWRLMSDRRVVIRRIESCIEKLDAMRDVLGGAAVDPLLQDYRTALSMLRTSNLRSLPSEEELQTCTEVLHDLRARLGALGNQLASHSLESPQAVSRKEGEFLPG